MPKMIIYSKPDCPACEALKFRMNRLNEPYEEIIVGKDITREEFVATFPNVRSMPHIAYLKATNE